MRCEECQEAATLHITLVRSRAFLGEKHLCEPHARYFLEAPAGPPPGPSAGRTTPSPAGDGVVRLDLVRLIISEVHEQQIVTLEEEGGGRAFSIVIGIFEATSIDRRLKGLPTPRPLTHDAWASTIPALGGEVQDVLINDLRDHTYYTEARIRQGDRLVRVDVRPSDAFALALTCAAPILIAERVLDEVT
jgi:bifunctional DNase/RNase